MTKLRQWLISKLAGDMAVLINVRITGTAVIDSARIVYVQNVDFAHPGRPRQ